MQAVLEGADLLENLLKKKPAEVEATTTTVTANAEAVKALKDWKDKDRKIYFMLVLYTTRREPAVWFSSLLRIRSPEKVSGHGRL